MNLGVRISNKLKRTFRSALYSLGLEKPLYKNPVNGNLILVYHNILPQTERQFNVRNLGVDEFRKHLRYLKKRYKIVSLHEMCSTQGSGRIAITFDDGLVNNLTFALPILEEEQVPATIYMTTYRLRGRDVLWPDVNSMFGKCIGLEITWKGIRFIRDANNAYRDELGIKLSAYLIETPVAEIEAWLNEMDAIYHFADFLTSQSEDYWRLMKGEELKIIAASPLISIGSHGITHANWKILSESDLKEELVESKKYLEQITGKEVKSLAYPFGLYNEDVVEAAMNAGYRYQMAVDFTLIEKHFDAVFSRFGIFNNHPLIEQLHLINLAMHEKR